ncbi:PREDICTED: colorectal cancer-associated protein 2, partial [Acanthisitta chloris]|uniref:colorectal cancer-associated protein 2 n=1 Tax=Acanthisitta chloris TaxID=57068 RepID=UPI0004F0EE42
VIPQTLSGKPKVYQGVRVKITVKELLQQRRARQAATQCSHSASGAPLEAEPIPSVPNCCPSWQFPNCLSCEESPSYLEQLLDSCLQSDAASDPAFSAFQPSSHYSSDTFQPVSLCFNQGMLSPLTPLPPSPPSALDTTSYSCPMEEWACLAPCPFPSPSCCCTACVSQHMDSRGPQYFPCPSTDCMDYLPPLAMADDFFRRDRSCDICYS